MLLDLWGILTLKGVGILMRGRLHLPSVDRSDDRGAVAILFAIFLVVFMVLLAFVVDLGQVYARKAQMQGVVDAAVLAGAGVLNCSGTNSGAAVTEASSYGLSKNGVAVNAPVVTGTTVYVSSQDTVNTFFGGFAGRKTVAVAVDASAMKDCGGGGYTLYAGNRANFNGGGSDTATFTGSVFGGGSGGGTCNSACPLDVPNGVGKVVITSGNAYSPVTPAMKSNADLTVNGTVVHTGQVDSTTTTNPVTYATQIGLLDVINTYLASGPTVAASVSGGTCNINLSNATAYPASTKVITCSGKAVLTGTANANLKLISATGAIEIDTNVGSSGNVVILSTGATGSSAVAPDRDITVYGTIYAPLGEVRTDGHGFTVRQGRIIAKDFLQNGNGGNFSADSTNDPYLQGTARLTE